MQPPRISPRRVFWLATAGVFLWAVVGGRTAGPVNPGASAPLLMSVQDLAGGPVRMVLTPAEFIFTGVQGIAEWAVERVSATHDANESVASLHEQIDQLKDQIDQRDRQIRIDQEMLQQIGGLAQQGLSADELLPASITGGQAGAGASLITLDKGYSDGVRRGMVVTACATMAAAEGSGAGARGGAGGQRSARAALVPQASILGMVDAVSAKTCSVRLMTDPRMKTQAVLVRRVPEGAALLTPAPCLVEGLGGGQMRCDTIDVGKTVAEPQVGDLAELADRNWPANVRYMVIGEVTAVGRKDTQLLRYDLTITPRVNLDGVQMALIVLRE